MNQRFCEIGCSEKLMQKAAEVLTETFTALGNTHWPNRERALKEVEECIAAPNICIGLCDGDELLGWIGLRPMYEKTWELHPLVVSPQHQNGGVGRRLVAELEKRARERGVIGIALGTDDEHDQTSLAHIDIDEKNIFQEITNIRNVNRHPFEFYKKCGYMIVGIIPNANGPRKPDIWMWKTLGLPMKAGELPAVGRGGLPPRTAAANASVGPCTQAGMNVRFELLSDISQDVIDAFSRWENDPELIPFSRPNACQKDLDRREAVTGEDLQKRLAHNTIYLIYLDEMLIGEMNYQVDPRHLYRKQPGTAWVGITIGEASARGQGIGGQAMRHLEARVFQQGLTRIELGVFEFNANAIKLYRRLGYVEIGRIPDFTFWQGRLWQDIRMEKEV
jgi:aminoglycoside 6'-N-acetyltransferase I